MPQQKTPTGFYESPYRQQIINFSAFFNLSKLNPKKTMITKGSDNDWLIKTSESKPLSPSPTPSTDTINSSEYLKLKDENKQLWDTMRLINSGKVVIASVIKTPEQARIAMEFLLWETQQKWRDYLESVDKDKFEKNPVIGLAFDNPVKRESGKEILGWMILTLGKKMTYEELIRKWNHGDEYNFVYDYDAGSLLAFNQLMEIKNPSI